MYLHTKPQRAPTTLLYHGRMETVRHVDLEDDLMESARKRCTHDARGSVSKKRSRKKHGSPRIEITGRHHRMGKLFSQRKKGDTF